jgi:hypothetical protein
MSTAMYGRSTGVRFWAGTCLLVASTFSVSAQQKPNLIPTPKAVTVAESSDLSKFDKQLIQLPKVTVAHADTAQAFMFGDKLGHRRDFRSDAGRHGIGARFDDEHAST